MARQYKTGLIVTGDAKGGIRALRATDQELEKLNKGFSKGSTRAQRFSRQTGGVARELAALRRAAAPVAAAVASVFAVNTLRNQINFADQLQKTNLRIGASTEALSQYNYVAQLSGVQFNQLATAWQRQTRRIAQAAQGTGEAQAALQALNLDAAELANLAPEQQFEAIAAAMQGVASESERVALAQKIWDSEGVNLIQIVNQGTDAIAAMRAEADALGLTISQQTANDMASFNDEVTRLQAVGEGLSRQILVDLVPAMTEGMQATSAWVAEMGGAAEILDTIKGVVTGVAAVMAGRYVGSLGMATAAKLAATQQAVAYQAALARMAGVSRIAATSQVALAGATRGVAAAFGLIGGPLGAAIIAAGAIYYFRDELNLTQQKIGLTEEELADLRQELREMSGEDLGRSIRSLSVDLEEATLKAATAREELAALRADENRGSGVLGFGAGEVGAEVRGMQAVADATERLREIEQRLAAARQESGSRNFRPLDGWLFDTPPGTPANDPPSSPPGVARQEADRLGGAMSTFRQLRQEFDPIGAAVSQFNDQVAQMDSLLAAGRINVADYELAVGHLSERLQGIVEQNRERHWFDEIGLSEEQLDAQRGYWARWLEGAQVTLEDFDNLASSVIENFQTQFGNAFESMIFDAQSLGDAVQGMAESMARSIVNALGQMAAQWLAYQAVEMLVGKQAQASAVTTMAANASAQSLQAGLNAYASTAAIPIVGPVLAPAAMGTAIAATAPLAAAVASTAAAGMAHDGIDSVPSEGTWLLDKGERVLSSPQADKLDQFLARPQLNGGGGVTVNVIEDSSRAGQQQERQGQDGRREVDVFVADIMGDGPRSQAIRNKFGLQPRGR